jgi:hypothetical protein
LLVSVRAASGRASASGQLELVTGDQLAAVKLLL